ncbi:MAG: outer membrane lipid asymmetry maintenance protein MlaD [Thiopseudomonas sp.]|nr:outer membrane lipid asymmetry maintenance protein MlaD [Thiopseudomonas sp.]
MRIRAVEISVGVFLLAGMLALLLLALRVSGLTVANSTDTYKLVAHFDNISGLTTRAKVTMAGVTVGKVVAIDFDTETYTGKVSMEVQSRVNNLPIDTTASILTAGLLGEKYISLSVGGEDEVLKDGDVIYDTQSSLVLEELIGKFLMNSVNQE